MGGIAAHRTGNDHRSKGETIVNTDSGNTRSAATRLVECSIWLRVTFIGLSALAAGIMQLVNGDVTKTSAAALAIGGAALGAISAWRGRTLLRQIDESELPVRTREPRPLAAGS